MTAPTPVTIPVELEAKLAAALNEISGAQATPYNSDPTGWWNRHAKAFHGLADAYEAALDHTESKTLMRHALIDASRLARESALDAERHADRAKNGGGS